MFHTDTEAINILTKAKKFKPEISEKTKKIYLATGSQSTQHLVSVMNYLLYNSGINAVVKEGEYNSIRAEIMDKNSALYEFNPDFVIILPYFTDNFDYKFLWGNLQQQTVIQSNLVIPLSSEYGRYSNNIYRELEIFNSDLYVDKPTNVIIANVNELAAQIGKRQWFDQTAYAMHKLGCAMKYIPTLADYFIGIISASIGKTRKCLVLDLDNTLWGGVVAEEGSLGITLDPNEAKGEAFRAFQSYCKKLKKRGIILAVASKNDEEIAKAPFSENPNMLLKLEDIAIFKANWNDKATSLREIANELNIGIDSLVFFDDNPAEREVISKLLPEVLVVDVPKDQSKYVQVLYDSGAFDIVSMSNEDVLRSESYANNAKREALQTSFADYEEYLKSLEMTAKVEKLSHSVPRFGQLINKSNQFNLRTRRYTDAEIETIASSDKHTLLTIDFKDKFDYYGIICCVILKYEDENCFIDTWVMSCRVLKRGIEKLVFNAILADVQKHNVKTITAEWIPTPKNSLVKNLLEDFNFQSKETENGTKKYKLAVETAKEYPHLIGEIKND
ncbi:MAG: HAD-IIIC family phosphatase [Oscillospiraceae bacterium]|nr:HAD-IIIC family phosphatase [Oscillospiraceae bacterium]